MSKSPRGANAGLNRTGPVLKAHLTNRLPPTGTPEHAQGQHGHATCACHWRRHANDCDHRNSGAGPRKISESRSPYATMAGLHGASTWRAVQTGRGLSLTATGACTGDSGRLQFRTLILSSSASTSHTRITSTWAWADSRKSALHTEPHKK